jgi:hypothetical protein
LSVGCLASMSRFQALVGNLGADSDEGARL